MENSTTGVKGGVEQQTGVGRGGVGGVGTGVTAGVSGPAINGISRVSQSFLHRNMTYSKFNFGNQADNATSIVCYISTGDALSGAK